MQPGQQQVQEMIDMVEGKRVKGDASEMNAISHLAKIADVHGSLQQQVEARLTTARYILDFGQSATAMLQIPQVERLINAYPAALKHLEAKTLFVTALIGRAMKGDLWPDQVKEAVRLAEAAWDSALVDEIKVEFSELLAA